MLKMAIMGAGSIANKMAATITKMNDVEAYAIAARDAGRAAAFAEKYGFAKSYGSYEEMLKDPEVQLVYIATPHSHHYKCTKMCLEAGKHVLCEKAFTVNAEQAKEILKQAEDKKLLLTEAIWTRYMPSRNIINKLMSRQSKGLLPFPGQHPFFLLLHPDVFIFFHINGFQKQSHIRQSLIHTVFDMVSRGSIQIKDHCRIPFMKSLEQPCQHFHTSQITAAHRNGAFHIFFLFCQLFLVMLSSRTTVKKYRKTRNSICLPPRHFR